MFWFILLSILFFLCLNFLNDHLNYFKKLNVPYVKSIPILGAFEEFVTKKKSMFEVMDDLYNDHKMKGEPFFGFFFFTKPTIFIKHPDLIKRVLEKDFYYFSDKLMKTNKEDLMHSNLSSVTNPEWKRLRSKLSPIFTSAKLKGSFCHINEIAKLVCIYIEKKLINNRSEIVLKDMSGLYTIDVTANVLFGFNPRSLDGVSDELHAALYSVNEKYFKDAIGLCLPYFLPFLFTSKYLGKQYVSFIWKLMPKIFEEREKSGHKRNDFVDLLLELKNSKELTENEIYAQVAIFFFGGYETTSSMLSCILYELSKNQLFQQKLRNEIRAYFVENEKVSYDAVAFPTKLPYLDRVLQETLRLYPFLPQIDQMCTKPDGYSLEPFSDFVIPHGMLVIIPSYSFSHDEKYFEDPWTFNPDRFAKDIPYEAQMPFGVGPRACIGKRLAIIVLKTAVMNILRDFRVEMNEKTPKSLTIFDQAFFLRHKEKLIVDFIKD